MRYFLELSYDGTDFAGWQRQTNQTTVQSCIEDSFGKIFQKQVDVIGCGRTDSGVHARYFVAHCNLDISPGNEHKLIYKLNRMLPVGIACIKLSAVPDGAHARFDAISRSYEYRLHGRKDPFSARFSTYFPNLEKLEISALNEIAKVIEKTTDFTSFCKAHGSNKTMHCDIMNSNWQWDEKNNRLNYQIKANRFLRGMVRLIVGTSLNLASGKITLPEVNYHIAEGTRSPHMKSAPAQGLALTEIEYSSFTRAS